MKVALLDINVLLALFDSNHVESEKVWEWFREDCRHGWATCPITENGFVRIISQPRYPNPLSTTDAIERLRQATNSKYHDFWPCSRSILDPLLLNKEMILGPRQITDGYLLGLCINFGGRFITMDTGIQTKIVNGAKADDLVII
ncbi:MAG: VapC toxin family PIN domain ribonuclease [Acidimicrobiales bacterium]|nr:VapC toxin family PIN domain ribonuclease [Acidimicrobiales bacterium]